MNSFKQAGFSLIEALLAVMIFSVFLLVVWQLQQSTFKRVSQMLDTNSHHEIFLCNEDGE